MKFYLIAFASFAINYVFLLPALELLNPVIILFEKRLLSYVYKKLQSKFEEKKTYYKSIEMFTTFQLICFLLGWHR